MKLFNFILLVLGLSWATPVLADSCPASDGTLQFVCSGEKLYAVATVIQGDSAQKLFNAISASYPNLVQKSGKFGMRPEIDLPNLVCGLQVNSHGRPIPPQYQCYFSTTF